MLPAWAQKVADVPTGVGFGCGSAAVSKQDFITEEQGEGTEATEKACMALRAVFDRSPREAPITCLLCDLCVLCDLCTTNPKNPRDLRRFSLRCQLRECVGVGISCGDQCGDDDAPLVGEVVTVGAGDFADQAMCAQQGQLARHRRGVPALLLL